MPDNVRPKIIMGWKVESGQDQFSVTVRFFGGGRLVLRGEMGAELTVAVVSANGPQNLYDVARDIMHGLGAPWTDPRTGVTYDPPQSHRPGTQE